MSPICPVLSFENVFNGIVTYLIAGLKSPNKKFSLGPGLLPSGRAFHYISAIQKYRQFSKNSGEFHPWYFPRCTFIVLSESYSIILLATYNWFSMYFKLCSAKSYNSKLGGNISKWRKSTKFQLKWWKTRKSAKNSTRNIRICDFQIFFIHVIVFPSSPKGPL